MEPLMIDGETTTLTVTDDMGNHVFVEIAHRQSWEHIFLTHDEAKRLAEWLTEWVKENEDKKDE